MYPLWNLLAFTENFLIIDEIPSGPNPSIIFKSKNFHKNKPNFFDGLTNKTLDQIWQRERDLMSFAMTSSENAMDRAMQLLLGDKSLEALRIKLDAEESAARDAGQASLFARFLFGSGFKGGFEGILGDIF